MLWAGSAAGMMDVRVSAFILHNHPVKGYFTASETFLGKTTISPPGPHTLGEDCSLEGSMRGEETAKGVRAAIGAESWKRLKETARSPPHFPPASMN